MQAIDHFFSALQRFGSSLRPGNKLDEKMGRLRGDFVSLVGPVVGADAAGDLFSRALERCSSPEGVSLARIGFLAAFFLGGYDDSMALTDEDWADIKETLDESAEEMDLNTLTVLMDELLKRGALADRK
jgi:hypothetical protein